jgi:hypothetical protein
MTAKIRRLDNTGNTFVFQRKGKVVAGGYSLGRRTRGKRIVKQAVGPKRLRPLQKHRLIDLDYGRALCFVKHPVASSLRTGEVGFFDVARSDRSVAGNRPIVCLRAIVALWTTPDRTRGRPGDTRQNASSQQLYEHTPDMLNSRDRCMTSEPLARRWQIHLRDRALPRF